ncbi:MAG: hypothetical protein ACI9RG_000080 [Sulfurimonas sp.]|jgi:hypothetical protein
MLKWLKTRVKMSTNNKNAWTTDIVLIDIINFLTKSYTKVIKKMINKSNMSLNDLILGYISTGYGTILGLNFSYISELISTKYSYFEGLKIAVRIGKVYQFIDILGHKNYIGDGLNDCARFAQIKGYTISTIMVSDTAYGSLKTFLKKYKIFNTRLMERGFKYSSPYTFEDKHAKKKEGRLVWLRKAGIINPPNTNLNSILRR